MNNAENPVEDSHDGLTMAQIGRWQDVNGFGRDPENGPGPNPGAPPLYRPAQADAPGTPTAWGAWLDWLPWPGRRVQDLGASRLTGQAAGPAPRGFPPTAPPAGKAAGLVPPAWAISPSPDQEERAGSPTEGNY